MIKRLISVKIYSGQTGDPGLPVMISKFQSKSC